LITARADAGANQYDQIEVIHFRTVETKAFPYQALYAIPFNRVTGILYRNHCAESRVTPFIVFRKHGDISIADLDVAMPKDSLETGGCQQAVRGRVRGAGARRRRPVRQKDARDLLPGAP